jgi:hypothetical protein
VGKIFSPNALTTEFSNDFNAPKWHLQAIVYCLLEQADEKRLICLQVGWFVYGHIEEFGAVTFHAGLFVESLRNRRYSIVIRLRYKFAMIQWLSDISRAFS